MRSRERTGATSVLVFAAAASAVLLLSGFGAPSREVRPVRTVSSLPLLYHFALISARSGRILKTGKARFLTAVADGRGGWYLVGGSGLSHRRAGWTADPGWGSPEAREVRSCSEGALAKAGRRLYLDGIVRKPGSGRICTIQAFDADTGKRLWVSAAIRPFKPSYAWNALAATPARVYVGGNFHWIGRRTTGILAALDPRTGKLLDWKAPSFGVDPAFHGRRSILGLTVSGSRLYAGGVFRSIAGKARHSIGALDSTSGSLLGWKTPVRNNGAEISEAGGYVVFAGENGISFVSARTGEPLNNPLTATLAMSNVGEFAVSGSLVYLGGYIDIQLPGNSGPSPHNLTAIDLATGRFTTWAPEVTANHGQVGPIVPSGREVLVLGEFGRAS